MAASAYRASVAVQRDMTDHGASVSWLQVKQRDTDGWPRVMAGLTPVPGDLNDQGRFGRCTGTGPF